MVGGRGRVHDNQVSPSGTAILDVSASSTSLEIADHLFFDIAMRAMFSLYDTGVGLIVGIMWIVRKNLYNNLCG